MEQQKELTEKKADCGLKCTGFVGSLDQSTLSLKTAQCSLFEDLNESYSIFPKSGMMQSGNVYRVQHLEYNRVGKDYIVLPTPIRSAYKGASKKRFFGSAFHQSNFHEYIRDGKEDGIYPNPELMEVLMSFPISWTELRQSETQSSQ